MRYFIDTEFYEDGHTKPVQLISLVREVCEVYWVSASLEEAEKEVGLR